MNNNNNSHQDLNQGNYMQNPNNQTDQKRHRRSKHEKEGRSFTCTYCNKSYLSKPALNNHLNSKHSDILAHMNITKRSRGRPRKTSNDDQEYNFAANKYLTFFTLEKRANISNEVIDIKQVAQTVIEDLYVKYNNAMFKAVYDIKDHSVLSKFVSGEKSGTGLTICDDIIRHYLDSVKGECNKTYFIFIVKFIILFRECLNITEKSKDDKYSTVEYTTKESAEIFPEQCNEFFSVFLENNYCFGFSEDEKNELIEIIQHFCHWLYENSYTKSKLSLAG